MPEPDKNVEHNFWTKRLANLLINVLLVLVPFFAFISVCISALVGHFTLVRLWDDAVLLILVGCALFLLFKSKNLSKLLFQDRINWLIFCYGLLTILLGIISYINHDVTLKALFYGLLINLRYLLLFVAVRLIAGKFSNRRLQKVILIPLLLVAIFALLQFFVLPHGFLGHFGYGARTYPEYITINQNNDTIRVQSFTRGPNPLGAYLAATICILLAYLLKTIRKFYLWTLFILSLVALYLSFSRGALIGAVIGMLIIMFVSLKTSRIRVIFTSTVIILGLILGISYYSLRNNQGVEDFLFHHSNHSTAQITSNEAHFQAFKNNIKVAAHDPLGNGPGTSGQASWYNRGQVKNPEDYFIQIAEETGWFGLVLFVSILVSVGLKLWQKRDNALALGMFGGLIAIAIISLFSYTWSDDTLAFLWWGLAGICLAVNSNLSNKQLL